jgi:YbbR domain-containing protein
MNLLRTLLLDNLGLKLVALLLAVLVYLNVYTDRPATMIVSFPIQVVDLPESLSLAGSAPAAVQAELRGTAKQLIRLRVTEPPVKVSLAGVGVGHFERALGVEDLPLPAGTQVQLDRLVSPRTIELQVDRKISRLLRVAPTIDGQPAPTVIWDGTFETDPKRVTVTGPIAALARLDSVRLQPVSVAGKRDTVVARVGALELPDWCSMDPERVEVLVPLELRLIRRVPVEVEAPHGASDYEITPERVTAIVSSPRRLGAEALAEVHATWHGAPLAPGTSRREAVRPPHTLPPGVDIHFDPDSVTVRRIP